VALREIADDVVDAEALKESLIGTLQRVELTQASIGLSWQLGIAHRPGAQARQILGDRDILRSISPSAAGTE